MRGAGPALGVGAVVVHEGRILLIKRRKAPLRGRWVVPGGTVELGETLEQAVVRELREETGLAVRPLALLGVFDRILREAGEVRYHYVIVDYWCERLAGTLRARDDALEAAFVAPGELTGFALPPKALEVVLDGLRRAGVPWPDPLPSPGPEA